MSEFAQSCYTNIQHGDLRESENQMPRYVQNMYL